MTRPFTYLHRATYADCTVGNHVYYARYLEILEAARGAFFRHLGASLASLEAEGVGFPVRSCTLDFRGMTRYDDEVAVEVRVSELARVKVGFAYRITCGSRLILEGQTLHGCVGPDERPLRIPADLDRQLRTFLEGP